MVRFALLVLLAAVLPAHGETLSVKRADGSDIKIEVTRPVSSERGPIVLAIDGSICAPEHLSEWLGWLRAERNAKAHYSVVVVTKPGPAAPEPDKEGNYNIGPDFRCTDEFKKYYTLDQRVLDHLQAIAYLRRNASWWDGRLLVWGFSDGAHIGARVATYTAETKAAVLLGMGGGTPMAVELEKMMCADAKSVDTCVKEFRARTEQIRKNPVPSRSWLGDANTYAAWNSRLDGVETNVLGLAWFPILLVHGERDGSVPVAAARALAEALGAPKGPIEYMEVPAMGHGLGSNLAPEQADRLRSRTLGWLLEHGLR